MGQHPQSDESAAEESKVRHDAERLRCAATKVDDDLAVACLITRARELEALAAILEELRRISRRFPARGSKPKG